MKIKKHNLLCIHIKKFILLPLILLVILVSTTKLYHQCKPQHHALFSTPSCYCFHTNQKRSLGKSLLFPLESSCQSEKLPLHPSLNNCADFSLGSLELLLVELQLKKTGLKSRKYQHPKQKPFTYRIIKERMT